MGAEALDRWLVTGASGSLGGSFLELLAAKAEADQILALSGTQTGQVASVPFRPLELRNGDALRAAVRDFRPTRVIHMGGLTSVAVCAADPESAAAVNVEATRNLALAAREGGAQFVFTSTDMVFDGEHAPYRESDRPRPLSVYARTKVAAERAICATGPALIVRVALMVGATPLPGGQSFQRFAASLRRGQPLRLFTDEIRTPLFYRDAARVLLALAATDLSGTFHLGGPERLSRYDLGARLAQALNIRAAHLVPCSRMEFGGSEPRPADLSLDSTRLVRCFPDLAPRAIQ